MRPHGWEARLDAYLHGLLGRKFDRVGFNCAHFILGAHCAVQNKDPAEVLRKLEAEFPSNEFGVTRFLQERGDMRGVAEQYFGRAPDPAMLCARRGDVALLNGTDGDSLGIVTAGGIVALSPTGLATYPLTDGVGFWRA